MTSSSIRPVDRVKRAVDVLQTVNSIGEITISELASVTGLSRGAANRYIKTFADLGFVARDEATRRYSVTDKVALLSCGAPTNDWKSALAKPILVSACQRLGWPLSLGAIRNGKFTVLENSDDASPLVVVPMRENITVPVAGRAGAHVLLAAQPPKVIDQILLVALKRDPHLLTRVNMTKDELLTHLNTVKKLGYDATHMPGSKWATVAVPVFQHGACSYSVSIRFRYSAVNLESAVRRFKPTLIQTAQDIAERIPTDSEG